MAAIATTPVTQLTVGQRDPSRPTSLQLSSTVNQQLLPSTSPGPPAVLSPRPAYSQGFRRFISEPSPHPLPSNTSRLSTFFVATIAYHANPTLQPDSSLPPSTAPSSQSMNVHPSSTLPSLSSSLAASSSSTAQRPRMGEAEKELKRTTTDKKLADAISKICDSLEEQMETVHREYQVPLSRVRRMIGMHWGHQVQKEPSAYNAAFFIKSQEVNQDRSKGSKLKMSEIHAKLQADEEMMKELENPRSKKVVEWKEALKEAREDSFLGTRGSGRAVRRQGTAVMNRAKRELENLSRLTGAFTFGMMCQGDFGTSITPAFWGIGPMEDFLMDTFKVSCFDFVKAAQSYACIQLVKGQSMTNDKMKTAIAGMILRGLREITGKKINMEYKHYSTKIVKKYRVQLTPWPTNIPFDNAHTLKADDVKELYDLLRSGTVRWMHMSATEYRKAMTKLDKELSDGTVSLPTRGPRSDKGKKHSTKSAKRLRGGEGSRLNKRQKTTASDSQAKGTRGGQKRSRRIPDTSDSSDSSVDSDEDGEDYDNEHDKDEDDSDHDERLLHGGLTAEEYDELQDDPYTDED
ncbi:hypothetical protein F5880DRAFT_1512343 [Lentinula raphanica]|nr:hypothetical protein F5880DRAFT_1512343 [Lentinula raphanica]